MVCGRTWRLWTVWVVAFGLLGLVLAAGNPTPVRAQTPTPPPVREVTDDEVNAIAKQLYCPVCEGIPLDTCGTQACEDWRQLIRQKLEEGWTEEQILTYFVDRYGERVLATPRPRGPHILVYVLPPVFVVAGVVILVRTLRSLRVSAGGEEGLDLDVETVPPPTEVDDDYRQRVEEELRRRL